MKHKLLLLIILLACSMAWAEHGFLSTIPIVHPLYGQLYDYEPKGVYPLPDGSMYVLGTAGWFDDINGIPPGAMALLSPGWIPMATWCGIAIPCGAQGAK